MNMWSEGNIPRTGEKENPVIAVHFKTKRAILGNRSLEKTLGAAVRGQTKSASGSVHSKYRSISAEKLCKLPFRND